MGIGFFPWFDAVYVDNDNKPLSYGKVYFRYQSTQSPAPTYNEAGQPNDFPIILDNSGRAQIKGDSNIVYRVEIYDQNNVLIRTHDNVTIGGGGVGPQGPQGYQGVKGDKGDVGPAGPVGPTGADGQTGPAGEAGPKGDTGETGATGPKGDTGDTGAKGDKGDTGADGPQGPRGYQGDIGPQGNQGPIGPQGNQGDKGDTGVSGVTYRGDWNNTTQYVERDVVRSTDGNAYYCNVAQATIGVLPQNNLSEWSLFVMQGAPGPVGPQGPQGNQGLTGATGPQGNQGIQGIQGPQGNQGIQGIQGNQGPIGVQGPQGNQGPKGEDAVLTPVEAWSYTMYMVPSESSLDASVAVVDVGDPHAVDATEYICETAGVYLVGINAQSTFNRTYSDDIIHGEVAFDIYNQTTVPDNTTTIMSWSTNPSGTWSVDKKTAYIQHNGNYHFTMCLDIVVKTLINDILLIKDTAGIRVKIDHYNSSDKLQSSRSVNGVIHDEYGDTDLTNLFFTVNWSETLDCSEDDYIQVTLLSYNQTTTGTGDVVANPSSGWYITRGVIDGFQITGNEVQGNNTITLKHKDSNGNLKSSEYKVDNAFVDHTENRTLSFERLYNVEVGDRFSVEVTTTSGIIQRFKFFGHNTSVNVTANGSDYKVKVIASDPNPDFLNGKIVSNGGTVAISTVNNQVLNLEVPTINRPKSAGVIDYPSPNWTDLGSGVIRMEACTCYIYDNENFEGNLYEVYVPQADLTIPLDGDTLVIADYNNNNTQYVVVENTFTSFNGSDKLPIYRFWREGSTIHSQSIDSLGIGLSSKIARRIGDTNYYARSRNTGLALSSPTGQAVAISNARVWAGAVINDVAAFDSRYNQLYRFKKNAGVWSKDMMVFLDTLYINDNAGLVEMGTNKYAVRYIFRSIGDAVDAFYVSSTQEYNTVDAARADKLRTDLPPILTGHCMLVGRIIVQKSATTLTVIESAFDTTFNYSAGGGSGDTYKVMVNASDPSPDYLKSKITSSDGSVIIDGSDTAVDIRVDPANVDTTIDGAQSFPVILTNSTIATGHTSDQGSTYTSSRIIPAAYVEATHLSCFATQIGTFYGLRMAIYVPGPAGDTLIAQTDNLTVTPSTGIITLQLTKDANGDALTGPVTLNPNTSYMLSAVIKANACNFAAYTGISQNPPNHFGRKDDWNAPAPTNLMQTTVSYSQTDKFIWMAVSK